jgi:hypothetical protein
VNNGQDGAGPGRDGARTVPETIHPLSALAELRERCGSAEGECTALRARVIDLQAERDRLEAALAEARQPLQLRLLEALRRR